ncbi:MAG: hypothetical protein KGJ59_10245 [Bacteroidota bacterium]|nr:hypothetical protein [Bacteroidota bacterium]
MKRFYSVVALTIVAFLAFGGVIRQGTLNAYSSGSNIVVQWQTDDESNVAHFYVQRSTSVSDGFLDVSSAISPKGNNVTYQFTDYSVFKTSETNYYYYRIRIEGKDGTESYSETKLVTHNTSGVRRTWGSLKAMFR